MLPPSIFLFAPFNLAMARPPSPDDDPLNKFFMATPFAMLALLFISAGIARVWAHFIRRRAGGVIIIQEPDGWRVRLPRVWPIIWGLGTILAISFVAIFALGFSTNGNPPHTLTIAVIIAEYMGGII